MTPLDTTSPPKRKFRIAWAVSLLAVLLAIGIIPRVLKNREARDAALASPVLLPEVIVVHPRLGAARTDISLPGNLQPLYRAAVFARTNGYIESRSVDIGSEVKAGQVLAVISAPEVDQQLNQAHADALTQKRYASLIDKRAVTQQSLDEADEAFRARSADVSAAAANISAAEATLKSRQANVERLTQMQGFERVVAPFDGVITARNIEVGDLVSAGSDNGSMSLFSIAQSNVLRVQVEVPQSAALAIKVGQQATITVQERPGRRYVATVTRSARSIDVAARTMLTEVQVDNRDGSLVPGMYGEVNFGMHVVSVSADRRVHFVAVDIGQDQGSQVEISQGLRGGETLVSNPSDLLRDGERVSIVE
jgi:RND family efflux transporter MFP subunit